MANTPLFVGTSLVKKSTGKQQLQLQLFDRAGTFVPSKKQYQTINPACNKVLLTQFFTVSVEMCDFSFFFYSLRYVESLYNL